MLLPPKTEGPPLLPPKRDVDFVVLLPPNKDTEEVVVVEAVFDTTVEGFEVEPPKAEVPAPPKAVPVAGADVTDPKADLSDPPNIDPPVLLA